MRASSERHSAGPAPAHRVESRSCVPLGPCPSDGEFHGEFINSDDGSHKRSHDVDVMDPDEERESLTVLEASRLARLSPRTIRRWVASGRVPSVLADGDALIPWAEFEPMVVRPARRTQ